MCIFVAFTNYICFISGMSYVSIKSYMSYVLRYFMNYPKSLKVT